MTALLIRLFIKDPNNIKDTKVRTSYGKFAGVVGIICNIILFAIKLFAGLLGGISVSVIADALNNLTDASSSFISLMGFKLSEKPADSEHPYGHGRYEYISGLTVAALILVIGVELLKSGIEKIISPGERDLSFVTLVILGISILIKIWMALFNKKIGKLISSDTLAATAADSRNDVISTLAVLVASIVSPLIGFDLDGYVASAVALFILYSGVGIIKDTIAPLLGKAPEPEFVDHIEEKILTYPNVLGIHDLMVHDYGPGRIFASVHIEMPSELDIMSGHDIADNIERDFLENEGLLLTVHYDPIVTGDPLVCELHTMISEIVSGFNDKITVHDLRIVKGPEHTNIIFDCVIPYGLNIDKHEIKSTVEARLREKYGNFYTVIKFENSFTG